MPKAKEVQVILLGPVDELQLGDYTLVRDGDPVTVPVKLVEAYLAAENASSLRVIGDEEVAAVADEAETENKETKE